MSYFNPVIDKCESGHYFAKLENHPLQSDRKTPRCSHCMAIGLDKAREELASVKQQLAEAKANDRHAMTYLEEARQASGHTGDFPSMISAISHMKKTASLGEKFARAKGRFHSQQAMCDLMDHLGMQCVRPTKDK